MSAVCCFCRNLVDGAGLSPALGARFAGRLAALEMPCHDIGELVAAVERAPGEARLCLDHIVGFEDARGGSITVRALLAAEAACGASSAERVEEDPRATDEGASHCSHCGRGATTVELFDNGGFCVLCAGGPS